MPYLKQLFLSTNAMEPETWHIKKKKKKINFIFFSLYKNTV